MAAVRDALEYLAREHARDDAAEAVAVEQGGFTAELEYLYPGIVIDASA